MKNIRVPLIVMLMAGLILVGCKGNKKDKDPEKPESQGSVEKYDVSYYNNNDFNDFVLNGNSKIENQWDGYGISSPFNDSTGWAVGLITVTILVPSLLTRTGLLYVLPYTIKYLYVLTHSIPFSESTLRNKYAGGNSVVGYTSIILPSANSTILISEEP